MTWYFCVYIYMLVNLPTTSLWRDIFVCIYNAGEFTNYFIMTWYFCESEGHSACIPKMALKKLRLLAAVAVLFCVYAVGQLLHVLFALLRNPRKALKRTARDSKRQALVKQWLFMVFSVGNGIVPPACLLDPALGSHEYVTANGLKFHCVCAGDTSKPLMLLLHGFPEVTSLTPHISHPHTFTFPP